VSSPRCGGRLANSPSCLKAVVAKALGRFIRRVRLRHVPRPRAAPFVCKAAPGALPGRHSDGGHDGPLVTPIAGPFRRAVRRLAGDGSAGLQPRPLRPRPTCPAALAGRTGTLAASPRFPAHTSPPGGSAHDPGARRRLRATIFLSFFPGILRFRPHSEGGSQEPGRGRRDANSLRKLFDLDGFRNCSFPHYWQFPRHGAGSGELAPSRNHKFRTCLVLRHATRSGWAPGVAGICYRNFARPETPQIRVDTGSPARRSPMPDSPPCRPPSQGPSWCPLRRPFAGPTPASGRRGERQSGRDEQPTAHRRIVFPPSRPGWAWRHGHRVRPSGQLGGCARDESCPTSAPALSGGSLRAARLMEQSWHSPPHRAVRLTGRCLDVGFGVATGATGKAYRAVVLTTPGSCS
jgi:hypothetical protein